MTRTILLAAPRGFCAGVRRAILMVEKVLEQYGAPVYVNHEIVHNRHIVESFQARGVIFEENIEAIPEGSRLILSAHGVNPEYRARCEERGLQIIDATCPLVEKVHGEARRYQSKGYKILYIGHKNHQEAKGVTGVADMQLVQNLADVDALDPAQYEGSPVVCLTQTTLSFRDTADIVRALKIRIPHLEQPGDICYATQNRQEAAAALAKECDFVVVIGSQSSSNSNRLVETVREEGTPAALFDRAADFPSDIYNYETLGITSGASVPEVLVDEAIDMLKTRFPGVVVRPFILKEEDIVFPLPPDRQLFKGQVTRDKLQGKLQKTAKE